MFEVSLTLKNLAGDSSFVFADTTASLRLPKGLALAPMSAPLPQQSGTQSVGDIPAGGEKRAVWYLRGDEDGTYPVNIDVTSRLMPFGIPVSNTFSSLDPITVYGRSMIKPSLSYPQKVTKGELFTVRLALQNTAPIDVYLAKAFLTQIFNAELVNGAMEYTWDTIGAGQTVEAVWTFRALASGDLVSVEEGGNIFVRVGEGDARTDSDGDGLPDLWETRGVDTDDDGVAEIDLRAMGADPMHKDVFIEIDWMEKDPWLNLFGWQVGGHHHKPKSASLEKVIDAFRDAPVTNPDGTRGINAHIDAGPDSVMNPVTQATWGGLSQAGSLSEVSDLGATKDGDYGWGEFDEIKSANFSPSRLSVFHYCLFAHRYGGSWSTGISRGTPSSDFIVADGTGSDHNSLSVVQQAGTLMHEFGHNLGLRHGGGDDTNHKPNYLSIMNYHFQLPGLLKDGQFGGAIDYSRTELDSLPESALDEHTGLEPDNGVAGFGTLYFRDGRTRQVDSASGAIDWNGDGSISAAVDQDVNNDKQSSTLEGYDDWSHLQFDGGAVGFGDRNELDTRTPDICATYQDLIDHGPGPASKGVSVQGAGVVSIVGGAGTHDVGFVVTNTGAQTQSYSLSVKGFAGGDFGQVPSTITLEPGESAPYQVGVSVPAAVAEGLAGSLTLIARCIDNPETLDEAEVLVYATRPFANADGYATDEDTPLAVSSSGRSTR